MKIIKVKISNYRNLDGINVSFDDNCNFIVGENNLGKSNFLTLLNILFTNRSFKFDDYKDPIQPIEIHLQIKLADIEIGHFQDLFDSDDYTIINIVARQQNIDDNITFVHKETNTNIFPSAIKCINFIHYDSLRNPITEINFDKGRGVGKFLKNIISQYLKGIDDSGSTLLDETQLNNVLNAVNQKISKIKSFNDFGIQASSDSDLESLLSKIVVLKDDKGDSLAKTGYGVQFLILVTLSILDKLQIIQQQRGNRGVFESKEDGRKSISILIGLDEPEIHLHPYMQRSLIKYLCSIISNRNDEFKQLIKELFDIDEFIGQIIVITHSPNIILNDYNQIIRFYSEGGTTKIISGSELILSEQLKKHLYQNFPFIKEAFFSRCAILVEGDSEYASFPYFGKSLSIDFDDLGICVIQARGNAIVQLLDITTLFGIPSVGITDKDDGTNSSTNPNLYQTNLRDFEAEIISIIDNGKEDVLRRILCELDALGANRALDAGVLTKKAHRKLGLGDTPFTSSLKLIDIEPTDFEALKAFHYTWFSINKGYPLGLIIGESLQLSEVPNVYQTLILQAQTLVENV